MYIAHFVNERTGELFVSFRPQDDPITGSETGWRRINQSMYDLFKLVSKKLNS